MATKYAGQNALNKLMQIIKTALNSKADKTNATTSAAGLMSATDKTKLDGIEAGATKTTVDAALDAGSANPVQNKAVKAAMDEKLDKSGGTITGSLKVDGLINAGNSLEVKSDIDAEGHIYSGLALLAPSLGLNNDAEEASVFIVCSGDNAARITSLSSDGKSHYSRFAVGTPTGDNDAATKAYVDSKVASGGVTVDSSVSSTSTNPVQNKAIKAELDKKLNKTGGTVGGNLVVDGSLRTGTFSATNLGIYTSDLSHWVTLTCDDGSSASLAGEAAGTYARLSVGAPTDGNDATTKTYVDNKVSGLQTAAQVKSAINSALTGVYTPKGSTAFASLPTAAAGNKGWVYNVSDSFTTTAAFVEGAGHSYGAGTNVVCVDAGSGSYKWDVLAGTVDLTELTADEVQTLWNSI